ncbi:MAG: metal-dependent hydrolase [Gemmatimonadetes bacterium]|nr:metal-dependent hydrolase [Gemmatimonadota bacterium]MCB9505165.1 metal-dependent hydrolase [Gemmatimonadales bacterium]MCB9518661.1 metal-dependent hydrolase [Gemmatimonadales bacterium]HPF61472.1 metal-dependent hydrolase [Gemmatimonadales bacterium]
MSRLGASITWLGHSAFHVAPPEGPAFLFDPWLDNPRAPDTARSLAASARTILLTHGHFDHITGTAELAGDHEMTVLCQVEVGAELVADGVPDAQVIAYNIGGAATARGLRATLVQATHSSSLDGADGRSRAIGTPCGFVVELPGGTVIYNTGDTGVFGDMALIAELYRPSILMLPIGDFYTMGPRQAAKAVELVDPAWVIPQHYGTFPGLPGTVDAFRDALPASLRDRVLSPAPGETIQ